MLILVIDVYAIDVLGKAFGFRSGLTLFNFVVVKHSNSSSSYLFT